MSRIWILAIFLFLSIGMVAQSAQPDSASKPHKPLVITFAPDYGFIVPHTSQIEHLIQGHSYGAHIQFLQQVSGRELWHSEYAMPLAGIDLFAQYTGNREALGYQFALTWMNQLPLNHARSEEQIGQRIPARRHWLGLGLGTGYSTRSWNLETNHQAAVLGSRINTALVVQYNVRLFRKGSFELTSGLRLTHFSNGAYKIPNLGTNNLSVFLSGGLSRQQDQWVKHPEAALVKDFREKQWHRWTQTMVIAAGLKEDQPPGGPKYLATNVGYRLAFRATYKSSFCTGVDVFYNSSLKPLFERRDDIEPSVAELFQVGWTAGYQLHFGRTELDVIQGLYVVDQWKELGLFYHRFGLRHFITPRFFCNVMLKTHFARADFGEWGIGWKL